LLLLHHHHLLLLLLLHDLLLLLHDLLLLRRRRLLLLLLYDLLLLLLLPQRCLAHPFLLLTLPRCSLLHSWRSMGVQRASVSNSNKETKAATQFLLAILPFLESLLLCYSFFFSLNSKSFFVSFSHGITHWPAWPGWLKHVCMHTGKER
jgi:hypothetical protein